MTEKPTSQYSCGNCHYAWIVEGGQAALCRRFPPQVYQSERDIDRDASGKITSPPRQTLAQFPVVMQTNWCGEHRRAKGSPT